MKRIENIPKMQLRPRDANKGDFGKVLIVGGSRSLIGAPSLSANAALRAGAGLVTVSCPRSIQQTVISLCPCATSLPLPEDENGVISDGALSILYDTVFQKKRFDVVAVGPGLGEAASLLAFIHELNRNNIPSVIDADGLNILARTNWRGLLSGPCVITPHPGELARLLEKSIPEIQADREKYAIEAAKMMSNQSADHQCVCLLKGQRTIVTDGEKIYLNTTGNPGMATGGTGDILTGVIAALLGQKFSTFDAAALGAHVHGLAGDLAAEEIGETSLIASDLLDFLKKAFKQL